MPAWFVVILLDMKFWLAAQGLSIKPNVTEYTVVEGMSQEIDCYVSLKDGKADIRWTAPPEAKYKVVNRNTQSTDGSPIFHHTLQFLSFSMDDEGEYKCTLHGNGDTPPRKINLHFQKDCERGKYDKDCKECSPFCKINETAPQQVSPCDVIDGTCFSCLDGYIGRTCENECDTGKYGTNCSFPCSQFCKPSNLPNESPCHYVSGSCRFGCQSGSGSSHCLPFTTISNDSAEKSQASTLVIIGSVMGVILLAISCVILVIICRRRHQGGNSQYQKARVEETESKI